MKVTNRILLLVVTLSIAMSAMGDIITLKDGTRYEGTFVSGSSRSGVITIKDRRGNVRSFAIQNVQALDFGSPNDNNSSYQRPDAQRGAQPGQWNDRQGGYPNDRQGGYQNDRQGAYQNSGQGQRNGYYARAGNLTIPAGAELAVRTIDPIYSRSEAPGRTYAANIDQDILDNTGAVAIPRGSDAELVVRTGNAGTSSSYLALDVDYITVSGRRYYVTTGDVQEQAQRQGIGENKRTAEMVGGGALLGTLIGAMAGQGKGAAIGAVAGAAAGAGAEVMTKGKEVRVPSETVLNFRLEKDLILQPVR